MEDFLSEFPELSRETLRFIKKGFDASYRAFSREYGDAIEAVFDPVLYFLVWFEKLLQNSPWPIVLICFLAVIYFGSRKISVTIGSLFAFLLQQYHHHPKLLHLRVPCAFQEELFAQQ